MKEGAVKIEIRFGISEARGQLILSDYCKIVCGLLIYGLFRDSPADESEDRSESNPRICLGFARKANVFKKYFSCDNFKKRGQTNSTFREKPNYNHNRVCEGGRNRARSFELQACTFFNLYFLFANLTLIFYVQVNALATS